MALLIYHLLGASTIGIICYSILFVLNNKPLLMLVKLLTVLMIAQVIVQDLTPIIKEWGDKINSIQETADKIANIGQGDFQIPMKGEITQNFNPPEHHGLDIGATYGTPVEATQEGEVTRVEWHDTYGNMIVIDHGKGLESLYGHLSGISVKVGYPVIKGQKIGTCGNTGRSYGSHLHFEIRKNSICQNPLNYLE